MIWPILIPVAIVVAVSIYFTLKTSWAWLVLIAVGCMFSPNEAIFIIIAVTMVKWLPYLYKRY